MKKIGRNEPCPCGSGKKFKKCHLGREDDLVLKGVEETPLEDMGAMIANLPPVNYGRSREMVDALDMEKLTGKTMGVKFVDLKAYNDLNIFGGTHPEAAKGKSGGVFINLYKTVKADPDNVYVAISRDIDDSTLIHELAHVFDYLAGAELVPGTLQPLGMELGVPVDHLEHTAEYGYWLDYLAENFEVQLDADDTIISYLYKEGLLLKGKEVGSKNALVLKSKSDNILKRLSENSDEIDALIRDLPGYIGGRPAKE